jgi:hypothetical protein
MGPAWEVALERLGQVTLGTVCALMICALIHVIEQRWFGKT